MLGFRRVMYWLQWFALVLIPIITVAQSSGWEALFAIGASVVGFLAMLTTALISTLATDLRARRTVPPVYAVLSVILWAVALIYPLTLQHSSDSSSSPSTLERLGVPELADAAATDLTAILCVGLWIASFVAVLARDRNVRTPPGPVADARSAEPEVVGE